MECQRGLYPSIPSISRLIEWLRDIESSVSMTKPIPTRCSLKMPSTEGCQDGWVTSQGHVSTSAFQTENICGSIQQHGKWANLFFFVIIEYEKMMRESQRSKQACVAAVLVRPLTYNCSWKKGKGHFACANLTKPQRKREGLIHIWRPLARKNHICEDVRNTG